MWESRARTALHSRQVVPRLLKAIEPVNLDSVYDPEGFPSTAGLSMACAQVKGTTVAFGLGPYEIEALRPKKLSSEVGRSQKEELWNEVGIRIAWKVNKEQNCKAIEQFLWIISVKGKIDCEDPIYLKI